MKLTKNKLVWTTIALLWLSTGAHWVSAQTYFPGPGAKWSYLVCCAHYSTSPYKFETRHYAVVKDTSIDQKNYHVLVRSDSVGHVLRKWFIYEDFSTKTVYYREISGSDYWLFNFAAKIGEGAYRVGPDPVQHIDSVLLPGGYYKRFITAWDTIMQGIGSLNNCFDVMPGGEWFESYDQTLLCFHRRDTLIYLNQTYNTCDTSFLDTGIENPEWENSSVLGDPYPTPSNEFFNLPCFLKKRERICVELLDLNGRVVRTFLNNETLNPEKNDLPCSLKEIEQGVYICRLRSGAEVFQRKIIKID